MLLVDYQEGMHTAGFYRKKMVWEQTKPYRRWESTEEFSKPNAWPRAETGGSQHVLGWLKQRN